MTEKIKNIFRSAASRNGSYSVGMIAIVIAIVVAVNLIAGQLPENIKNIDISDNKIYEISKTSKDVLKKLDQNISFQVYAEKSAVDERIKTFIEKYTSLSDKINVEWIDPVQHPAKLSENNISENMILITNTKSEKSTTVSFSDIIVSDMSSYYTTGSMSESEFDGEGQLTSAINYVTSDAAKKLYYTTGHGENTFSTAASDLLEKNNLEEAELNLLMESKVPEDSDLLVLYGPTADIAEEEKTAISEYLTSGGKVFLMLGDAQDATPNIDALMSEYGMETVEGYMADMQRCYQGNYYYIFPEISASGELAQGLSTEMVLLINSRGMKVTEPKADTITVTPFMSTSSTGYAVTEEAQQQGTYTLGAVAEGEGEARLTVVSTDSLINPQITDSLPTLENLDIFMNIISSNFDDIENVAIEPKSLQVENNTMQHAGIISLFVIFGIPAIFLIYGFIRWMRRRRA